MKQKSIKNIRQESLPSWERGLKYQCHTKGFEGIRVAPLVGAWIEITSSIVDKPLSVVAPLVGAWIEITTPTVMPPQSEVAPLVGAWIEILMSFVRIPARLRRSPRGSVD